MGRKRRSPDDIDGVLVVDKPAGPTSHDVVQVVRRAAGQKRVGHTGTLDPAATGVLVVCLGRATKLVQYLQAGHKTYAAQMVLGVVTSSQDADGEVLSRTSAAALDEQRVCEVLTRFQGEIDQVPPMVSAVKVGGRRLHELARRGEEVERESRRVIIHDLMLDAYDDRTDPDHPRVSFLVTCSAGTYVRTLAHDIGEALGVGASLMSLRRVANGPFGLEDAHDLDTIRAAGETGDLPGLLLAPEAAVARALPMVDVDDADLALAMAQGKPALDAQGRDGIYAVTFGERLLGIYRDRGDRARSELVWTRPEELALSAPATPSDNEGTDR
ncbi:MAG TPA: tRNA pseudouridine(55) synthase TruB [Egicoccus sp.]|nr:tRNA pseudouridine(55) synthase TruB [Egicoccus sp.]HSK22655.1 tRNA pseudouridine(55) synthase TruB [Egicoccus sp.]